MPGKHEDYLSQVQDRYNVFEKPEFQFDSKGRVIISFPGKDVLQLSVTPGSKIVSQAATTYANKPMTDPASLRSGSLYAETVIQVGKSIYLDALRSRITVGEDGDCQWIMDNEYLRGVDKDDTVFGFFLRDMQLSNGLIMEHGDVLIGNYPTSYILYDNSNRRLFLSGDLVVAGDIASANFTTGVSGYKLEYLTGNAEVNLIVIRNGTVYTSDIVSGTVGGANTVNVGYVGTTTADSVPTGLTCSSTGVSTGSDGSLSAYVVLTWTGVSSNTFDRYQIRYKKASLTYYTYIDSKTNTITIEGLTPNISYNFGVASINKYGTSSAFSSNIAQTTAADTVAPAAVTAGSATGGIQYNIVEWTHNSESDIASYNIYRSETNDSGTGVLIGNSRTNYFVDGGRTGGTTYYYWIKAVDTSGNVSATFSVVKSAAPRNVGNTDISETAAIAATKILIDGTVYLSDWRHTNDITKIDGGNIYTGSVTTTQLNFTPVQSTNVIASINASVEGITIDADNLTISSATTFVSGYDPTTKTAAIGGTYDSAASGARVRIFPAAVAGTQKGLQIIDDAGNDIFAAYVLGTGDPGIGDVIIGNYTGNQGIKYDKSAGTTTFAGTLSAAGGTLGTITSGTLTGLIITGGTIRTAASKQRVVMSDNQIEIFNSADVSVGTFKGLTGTWASAIQCDIAEIDMIGMNSAGAGYTVGTGKEAVITIDTGDIALSTRHGDNSGGNVKFIAGTSSNIVSFNNIIPNAPGALYLGNSTYYWAGVYLATNKCLYDNGGVLWYNGAAVSTGEANTSSSAGGTSLVLSKSGVNLPFKGISVGSRLTLTSYSTYLYLDHTTGSGYNHIPTDGSSYQMLRYSSAGTAQWSTDTYADYFRDNGDTAKYLHYSGSSWDFNANVYTSGTITAGTYLYGTRCYLGGTSYCFYLSGSALKSNTHFAVDGNISAQTITATTQLYASGGSLRIANSSTNPSVTGEIRNYASGGIDQFRGQPGDGTWRGSFDMTAY